MSILHSFSASGSCDDISMLKNILSTIFPYLNYNIEIEGFIFTKAYSQYDNNNNILVFCTGNYDDNSTYKEYPFSIQNNENGISMLATHIIEYINSLSDEDLKQLGMEPTGYEEDYEIGWNIFIPDWYFEEYGIEDYTSNATILAVKPAFIEYGK